MATTNLISSIRRSLQDNADRVFLIESMTRRTWTYAQFGEWALRAASLFRDNGIRKGDRVALMLLNSAEFVALYWGCLLIGATAVPVSQSLHPKEMRFILTSSKAKLLVFSRCTRAVLLQAVEGLLNLRQVRVSLGQEQPFHPEDTEDAWTFENARAASSITPMGGCCDDDVFSILFTSGTTSTPKGVAQSIGSQFGNAVAFNSRTGIAVENRFLHVWPMAYSTGILNTLISPFMAGSSVVLDPIFSAQTALSFWKSVMDYGVNTVWLAPTMIASLVRMDRDATGINYCQKNGMVVFSGSAPLSLKLRREFNAKYNTDVMESYGLSELLILSTNDASQRVRDNSAGRLLDDVVLHTVDNEGNKLENGAEGEIVIGTPYMMLGYLNPETSAVSALDTNTLPTGDVGRIDADGFLYITDRQKDLIIRGGQNLSPRAIRDVVMTHPAVEDAVVVGLPHDFYGEEVGVALKLKCQLELENEKTSIMEHCRRSLNRNAVPTRMMQLKSLPTGISGKVLTIEIREKFQS